MATRSSSIGFFSAPFRVDHVRPGSNLFDQALSDLWNYCCQEDVMAGGDERKKQAAGGMRYYDGVVNLDGICDAGGVDRCTRLRQIRGKIRQYGVMPQFAELGNQQVPPGRALRGAVNETKETHEKDRQSGGRRGGGRGPGGPPY
jgi:hypothetical protein